MTLAISILSAVLAGAVAAVLTHVLTARRDQKNRRSDLRVEYLMRTYLALADAANRSPDPSSRRAIELGLAEIQLLGAKGQTEIAISVSEQLAETGGVNLNDLLRSLRDDLREELGVEPVVQTPIHLRFAREE